jgi:nucleotide-binding universal stress UspA family protein
MRRLVVVLSGMVCDQKACAVGLALAKRLGAHVEGLFIRYDASEIVPRLGEGLSGVAIDSLLEATNAAADEASARARATLAAAAAADVELAATPSDRPGLSAVFQDVAGPSIEMLDAEARLANLLIFGEPGDGAPADWMGRIEHSLLAMRRPLLIARGGTAANFGEKILVTYNGSLESANALVAATPILVAAREVEVLEVRESDAAPHHAAAATRYLRQHGVNASAHDIKLTRTAVGEEIAARSNSIWASLIVMGGYGRSRLREFILGGATRHLVHHAPVPVLLCH